MESFDSSNTPPATWEVSGFTLSTSAPRSTPNCLLATGNTRPASILTRPYDFTAHLPRNFSWHERRSSTAASYRLRVDAVVGSDSVHLADFTTISGLNVYVARSVPIGQLVIQPGVPVRFRLTLIFDSTNTSGLLRIDDVVVSADGLNDLGVSFVHPLLRSVRLRQPIPFMVRVRNYRPSPAAGGRVVLTTHSSSGPERTDRRMLGTIPAADSSDIPFDISLTRAGPTTVRARLEWEEDQNPSNDADSALITADYPPGSVLVSEFLYLPVREDEQDWMELYIPGADTVDAAHLVVTDRTSAGLRLTTSSRLLAPGAYVVAGPARALESVYGMPATAGFDLTLPSLNNTTPDAAVVRSVFGMTLDSAWYEPSWGVPGRSLERRDHELPSLLRTTWKPSKAAAGATPGARNSVQRHEIDAGIRSVPTAFEREGLSVLVSIVVANEGRRTWSTGSASVLDADGEVWRLPLPAIAPEDSVLVSGKWQPKHGGRIRLFARVAAPGDGDASNDTLSIVASRDHAGGTLLVNEIMYDPGPGDCEWVELFNPGSDTVDVSEWTLADRPTASGSQTNVRIPSGAVVPPGGLAVIAADTVLLNVYPWLRDQPYRGLVVSVSRASGLGLNAGSDIVLLRDQNGNSIDSVAYDASWHLPNIRPANRSLERVVGGGESNAASTWTTASGPYGASPGRRNGSALPGGGVTGGVELRPNPFSPDGDGHEDLLFVRFSFGAPNVVLRARVFDDTGRPVRTVADGLLMSGTDQVVWDGRNDAGRVVPIGPYIVLLEASNIVVGFSTSFKGVAVVAR